MQLALETSTNICSVAYKNTDGEIYEKRTDEHGSHSEQLFLFIEDLKKNYKFEIRELDSIIVSEGPGSYTGLRISASAVKGLLFQTDIKLYTANTLASFAAEAAVRAETSGSIHSVIDARRVHLYHQKFTFDSGKLSAGKNVEVIPIEQFEMMIKPGDMIIGTGLKRISDEALSGIHIFSTDNISAKSLFRLAEFDRSGAFVKEKNIKEYKPEYFTSRQV